MNKPVFDQFVTFLYTNNLPETNHFYQKLLGLPLVLDQGACQIYQITSQAFIGFCTHRDAPRTAADSQHIIITLVTDQVDARYTALKAQGVTFEKPPTHNPKFNIYHAFLRDPNGYLIEIQTFLDPTWPSPV